MTAARAPVRPLQTHSYALNAARDVEVETTEWIDGGPSDTLRIDTADGRAFKVLAGLMEAEVEESRRQISRFLAQPSAD